jgi:hypothetical protein
MSFVRWDPEIHSLALLEVADDLPIKYAPLIG